MYAFFADLVLIAHAAFVAFVVLMLPCILLGRYTHWSWVRVLWLRVAHLVGICIVAAQAWAGVICPLTTLEMFLREESGLVVYSGSFVQYWLQKIIYWDLPAWVFTAVYTLFVLLVGGAWYFVPPVRGKHNGSSTK